jgi:hypothetical protein
MTDDALRAAYTDDDVAYWRRQIVGRNVEPDLPWSDADVIAVVARFIGYIDALAAPDSAQEADRA